jgi:hypothetical protein
MNRLYEKRGLWEGKSGTFRLGNLILGSPNPRFFFILSSNNGTGRWISMYGQVTALGMQPFEKGWVFVGA